MPMSQDPLNEYGKKSLSEIENIVTRGRLSTSPTARYSARYVGGVGHEKREPDEQSSLLYYGYKVPELRALFKKGFSFSNIDSEFFIWDFIFKNSSIYEVKSLALMYVRAQKKDFFIEQKDDLLKWVHHVDNWAHSDELSHIYAHILESEFKKLKALYEQMNRSKNPWLRRQSLVGVLNYQRQRAHIPALDWALKLVEALLKDPHYYVQKGVGWTLREIYNADSKVQVDFVKQHIAHISPTAWYACSENYSPSLKEKMNGLRQRQKKKL